MPRSKCRICGSITGRCVALSNSTVNRRKSRCAGLGWVRGPGEASDEVTVKRGIARGIGSMAAQAFSTRSACAVPRLGSTARRCTARAAALTNIGRSLNIPSRAAKGGRGLSTPLRPLASGVPRLPLRGRGAQPSFPPPRRAAREPSAHLPRARRLRPDRELSSVQERKSR